MPESAFTWTDTTSGGLLEAAPDAMVVIDRAGVVVLANQQAHTLFGYARTDLVGQQVEILIPEVVREVHRKHRAHYVDGPHVREMGSDLDLLARRRDGSEFPVEISLAPLQTDHGLLVSAAIRDITSKRREERLFRGLLEAAPDGMVIVDARGQISLVNAQVEAMFGYQRRDLIGQPVEMLVPDRFRAGHEHFRVGYTTEPRTRPMGLAGELFARRRDGSEFPVEISLAPLETDDGTLVSAAIRDVTERRALAEETNRVKDEFFATVSHELRTPLTALIGYGELLGDLEELSVRGQQFLSVMMRSAERERRLVDDLLTLAQIGEQGMTLRSSDLDVAEVAHQSVQAARPAAEERGLRMSLLTHSMALVVRGDPDRLGQAVDNVVANAIKFTEPGGSVQVEVGSEGAHAVVDVSDTGIGLGDIAPGHLFERLYRAPAAVAAQVPGAGLGLPIAQAVVEAHGGSISVVRSDENGSVFRIALPLVS